MHQTSPSDQTSPALQTTPEQRAQVHQALEDEDTYNKLYRSVTLWVLKLAAAPTHEEAHAQAEDILHEAIAQAFAKLHAYDPARSAVNWLLGFALNIIRQRKRYQHREPVRTDVATPDQARLITQLHGQAAQELLDLVSEPEQQILRLGIVEGLSGRELATELGITEGAARVRLYRAKQQLQRAYFQLP